MQINLTTATSVYCLRATFIGIYAYIYAYAYAYAGAYAYR
jgi:hypothetical protein